ncbi:MAG: hypothetical protein ACRCUY_02510 [Thermoguttaceae bacterium]
MNTAGVRGHGMPLVSGTNPVGFRRGINSGAPAPARKAVLSIFHLHIFLLL